LLQFSIASRNRTPRELRMKNESPSMLRIGDWRVDPDSSRIHRNGETTRLDVRTMRLLLCLAERAGQVVSIEDLIAHVWAGIAVSSDSVYQAITALRRQLGDDPRKPEYIETVPRLGYRMIAAVGPWTESFDASAPSPDSPHTAAGEQKSYRAASVLWGTGAIIIFIAIGVFLHERSGIAKRPSASAAAAPPQLSIAVLPFLDLTEGMSDEEFADGMTEELIDKLSKVPGLSVPGATSSFYFKGKQKSIGEIARTLNVAYILDGSVRKSGGRVRIAARLVRADNSYVVWSETYDRPFGDLIMVQDDIAGEVTKALKSRL